MQQGNLQLADMPHDGPFDGLVAMAGAFAHGAADLAAIATFGLWGGALVLGVFAAIGLKKLADRARYAQFRKQVVISTNHKMYKPVRLGAKPAHTVPAE